jgi:hypothetical protein
MQDQEQHQLFHIASALEKKYPMFKKMDIYASVSQANKKARDLFPQVSDHQLEEVKRLADLELERS